MAWVQIEENSNSEEARRLPDTPHGLGLFLTAIADEDLLVPGPGVESVEPIGGGLRSAGDSESSGGTTG